MDMTYAKRYAESLVFNGEMMVLGGYNERQGWLDAVEKLTSGGWQEMEPWKMPRKIFDFCAVQMDSTRIMVLGNHLFLMILKLIKRKKANSFLMYRVI